MLHIAFIILEQLHQAFVRRLGLNIEPVTVHAQKNIGREKRHAFVAIDKGMIFYQ